MAEKQKKTYRGKRAESGKFPFKKQNYMLFGLGLLFLVFGYIALAKGPWDSFWSLTAAPIFLVLGYCVIIPLAILYRTRKVES